MDTFLFGGTSVSISRPANWPLATPESLPQQSGLDSAGNRYVYGKGIKTRPVALVFPRVSPAELAGLTSFFIVTVAGSRHPFVWTDQTLVDHLVRLTSWRSVQVSPVWHRVEINLEEIVGG